MLTAYDLACGHAESAWSKMVHVTLWREHGIYYAGAYDHTNMASIFAKAYHTLAEARKAYRALCREHKAKSAHVSAKPRIWTAEGRY